MSKKIHHKHDVYSWKHIMSRTSYSIVLLSQNMSQIEVTYQLLENVWYWCLFLNIIDVYNILIECLCHCVPKLHDEHIKYKPKINCPISKLNLSKSTVWCLIGMLRLLVSISGLQDLSVFFGLNLSFLKVNLVRNFILYSSKYRQ